MMTSLSLILNPAEDSDESSVNDAVKNYMCVYAEPESDCHVGVPSRKVVSHIFGRNKRQTLAIPESCWITICRRHYQRESYRRTRFPIVQCKLVLLQLEKFIKWGRIRNYTVIKTKKGTSLSDYELDLHINTLIDTSPVLSDQIHHLIMHIQHVLERDSFDNRVFPQIQILPNVDPNFLTARRGLKRRF
ncbi:hypothetical protein V1512DRAFT_257641 [Lipomyces arxii]|uniref:uncharacterized protein n=1 Tax=Lipomyces arxii TaxID=56418 RepID=UPI0034CDDB84